MASVLGQSGSETATIGGWMIGVGGGGGSGRWVGVGGLGKARAIQGLHDSIQNVVIT